jgi:transposase-like protein
MSVLVDRVNKVKHLISSVLAMQSPRDMRCSCPFCEGSVAVSNLGRAAHARPLCPEWAQCMEEWDWE